MIAASARTVVIGDACFIAPAVIVQLVTGQLLSALLGWPVEAFWWRASVVLFFVVGACWLPVLFLQLRARDLTAAAADSDGALPPDYHRAMRAWFWPGWPAFLSVLAIFWLMVVKPG